MRKNLMILICITGWILSACSTTQPITDGSNTPQIDSVQMTPTYLPTESPPRGAINEFSTDFSKHSVPYSEILSGGPPKDGIPPIDTPNFVTVENADDWLKDREPVVFIQVGDNARAYPIQILIWHEIVNDTVGNEPLIVSFCPLCNTAIAFKRTFNGQVLDFGTTGRLRYSNLIMYDRQSETWWQQATGDAIAGEYTGAQLEFYPASIISWEDFKSQYPNGTVLSRETGHSRDYGRNPYVGYDDISQYPFLFSGKSISNELSPMARILTIELNNEAVAYSYNILEDANVINDAVGGEDIAIFWMDGTNSALDTEKITEGREVGSAVAYSRTLDDQILYFEFKDGFFVDIQTGSKWNILGTAVAGKLEGMQLVPVVSVNHFWFSWAAFKPETRVYQP